jgi:hypothetical protein
VISVEEVAAKLDLKEQQTGEGTRYIGPNPTGVGATRDGFVLNGDGEYKGSAYDHKAGVHYSSFEVAKMADIDYDDYEASTTHPATANFIPENKFDTRTLEERGLNKKAKRHFHISGPLGIDRSWGEYREFPTYTATNEHGRHRLKFRSPQLQLQRDTSATPAKTIWDKKTKSLPMPPCYGANFVLGNETVWIVNSELAVWLFWQEGLRAICPLGEGRSAESWDRIAGILDEKGVGEVCVMLDNDVAGRKASVMASIAMRKSHLRCTVYDLSQNEKDGYDASDLWEYHDKQLRNSGDFSDTLMAQPIAGEALLLEWQRLTEILVDKAAAKAKLDKKLAKTKQGLNALQEDKDEKIAQASEMIRQLRALQIFKTDDGDYCIVVDRNGLRTTYSILSDDFKHWMRLQWLGEKNLVLPKALVEQVCDTLCAIAAGTEEKVKAFYRSGYIDESRIYIDLADKTGRAVEIDAAGWRIIPDPPVFFRRSDVVLPLPEPKHVEGKDRLIYWNRYKAIINHGDDDNWVMMVAWLVSALVPGWWSCPIIMLHGEQGSGKTYATKLLRNLNDPNEAFMVKSSKDEKDLVISAEKGRCFCLDNESKMSGSLSDLLAALITGSPYVCRTLYTTDGMRVFKGRRAMILNGIPEKVGGEDLGDRALKMFLPSIKASTGGYMRESTINREFETIQPYVLGMIFDAMSLALRNAHEAEEKYRDVNFSRMSDFTAWVLSCEKILPIPEGKFFEIYSGNIIQSATVDLQNRFAQTMVGFLQSLTLPLQLTSQALYDQFTEYAINLYVDKDRLNAITSNNGIPDAEKASRIAALKHQTEVELVTGHQFPKSAISFGLLMRRVQPSLRKVHGYSIGKATVDRQQVNVITQRKDIEVPLDTDLTPYEQKLVYGGD